MSLLWKKTPKVLHSVKKSAVFLDFGENLGETVQENTFSGYLRDTIIDLAGFIGKISQI